MLLPTTLVGSYAQPDWLIDRAKLAGRFPRACGRRSFGAFRSPISPRRRTTRPCLRLRRRRTRASTSSPTAKFAAKTIRTGSRPRSKGIDIDKPGVALDRSGHPNPVPRIAGPIRRKHAVEVDDLKFLRAHTARKVKMTVPGPFTMSQQAENDYYPNLAEAALAYAEAVNAEIKDFFAAGADIVQVDEPYMQARPKAAEEYGLSALNHALEGVNGASAVHICFGYAAIIHERPSAYSFLPQLKNCRCRQISIETAQSKLDCAVLDEIAEPGGHSRRH